MPLMRSKSKKAFEHNVETEMKHGKPQDQSLAIAYSVKRKPKKKMAEGGDMSKSTASNPSSRMDSGFGKVIMKAKGGEINDSAKTERRPMPDERDNDSKSVSRNSSKKVPGQDSWTDQPTVTQAQSNNGRRVMPIKRPKMVPTDTFSTRLYNKEGDLEDSASPGPYGAQPPREDDEEGPDRQGPEVSDMEREHSNHRKPYAKGGKVDMQPADNHEELMERDEESDLMDDASPSEDEGAMDAHSKDEMDADSQNPNPLDMEEEHSNGRKPYAKGGMAHEMDEQPEDEMEEEHHASVADAVMARLDRLERLVSGSPDMDEAVMAADGGILSHDSIYSDDSDQVDLSRNADEDANEEDQTSFNALRKENYSESEGLDQLDQPRDSNLKGDDREDSMENKLDTVDSIMRKMSKRKQK